jgi:hypothetical protein
MVKAGKPAKVAIVAIMRKLLILTNALIRDRRKWAPLTLDQHGHLWVLGGVRVVRIEGRAKTH